MLDKRELIQKEAATRIIDSNYTGIILVAPRVGKSKILIDSIVGKENWNIIITSPYETIKDNWIKEGNKWECDNTFGSICHRSLDKLPLDIVDLLVIDEIQTLSERQIQAIIDKKPKRLLGLTGTLSDSNKLNLAVRLDIKPIYEYNIDQAIADGIISNFEIVIVECEFDDTIKNILSGTKKKSFYTTELGHYKYLTKQFERFKVASWSKPEMEALKMKYAGDRARLIYESESKYKVAKKIIDNFERCIIFTGLQKVADTIAPYSFHSKSEEDNLQKFIDQEINKVAVIDMVNMGITIPNLKVAVLHQLKSNSEMSLQKILRVCNLEDDKTAKIYVTVYKDSVDNNWVNKAFEKVNASKITRINYKHLNL